MTDTTTPPPSAPAEPPVRWEWRIAIALVVLAFDAVVVWWCLVYGKSENLLHQNALSWSYITSIVVLGGIGFGATAAQLLPHLMKKP